MPSAGAFAASAAVVLLTIVLASGLGGSRKKSYLLLRPRPPVGDAAPIVRARPPGAAYRHRCSHL